MSLNKTRQAREILGKLRRLANPLNVQGMARYGITPAQPLGIPVKTLRTIAREIGVNHDLALLLWKSGIHEARILATIVEDPEHVTESQMERWASAFDSWDICDQACANCFERTRLAWTKTVEWSKRKEEFVRRAAFSLMARLAVRDRESEDSRFTKLFPLIRRGAEDERALVRKSVSWALRQIGKRNSGLNREAIALARQIAESDSKSAQWVSKNVLTELTAPKTRARLKAKRKAAGGK